MNKRGYSIGSIKALIMGLVLLVVLFRLAAALVPEAQSAGDTLNQSGVPLGNLFGGSGIVFLIVMVGILLGVVGYFLAKLGSTGR